MEREQYLKIIDEGARPKNTVEIYSIILDDIDPKDADSWMTVAREDDVHGAYQRASDVYYTLYKKEGAFDKKIKFGIFYAQMLINAANITKASEVLIEIENLGHLLPKYSTEYLRAIAWVKEKQAWVADYENKPDVQLFLLAEAKLYTESIRKVRLNEGDNNRLLTIEHFTGRALVKRALLGDKTPDEIVDDLETAEGVFKTNWKKYYDLNSAGALGFNEAWLARIAMIRGDFSSASMFIETARQHFEEAARLSGSDKIMDHHKRLLEELAFASKK